MLDFVSANKFQIGDSWSPYFKIIQLIDFLNVVIFVYCFSDQHNTMIGKTVNKY
jgi:hypothetical protein